MKASNINYHGMNLQVRHVTEGATGHARCTALTAIISIDGFNSIKPMQDITDLMSVREQLDILHRALNS